MAILLVPLAMAAGSPKKINKGSVSKEPPPAMVLIIPAKKPTTTNSSNSYSIIMRYPLLTKLRIYGGFIGVLWRMKAYKALLKLLFSGGKLFFVKKIKKMLTES